MSEKNKETEQDQLEKDVLSKVDELFDSKTKEIEEKLMKRGDEDGEKSVLAESPLLRRTMPFVKLSKKMEDFVKDFRNLRKGIVSKAMSEGTDTEGGFLVPEEFNAEVIRHALENSIMRPRARVFTTMRDKLSMPVLNQASDQYAGVAAYWTAESGLKVASYAGFEKITLTVHKLIGLVPVPDELLDDSAVNLANFLVSWFGDVIGYKEDYAFLRGTGVGQPQGILTNDDIYKVNRNTASAIKSADVFEMWQTLPAWATIGSVWITTKAALADLMNLREGVYNGSAIAESAGGFLFRFAFQDGAPGMLLGAPVLITDKLPAVGTEGDLILCNLSYYFILDRSGIKVDVSIHDRFRYDETTFRFVKRTDGQVALPQAFVVLSDYES